MEETKPKSRRELYNEKLKERDLYGNGFIERFTENGAGAPLRDNEGKIITKRRTMLNNDYEDIFLSQRNRTPNIINNNNNQQINILSQTNSYTNNDNNDINNNYLNNNNNFFRTLTNKNVDLNNIFNDNNSNYIINNDKSNEKENIINNDFQMTNFHRRPQSQINFSNTLNSNQDNINENANRTYNNVNNNIIEQENNMSSDPFGNNYQGTGILPRDRTSETDKRYQNQVLRETWLREIEEKKQREAKKKEEQKELDLKYEAKYLRDVEEQKENERLEKLKRKENEQITRNINNLLIENKQNQIKNENEVQNNMMMNGNNLELLQPQEEYNPDQQNFRILRNNNINNNNINNYDEMQLNQFGLDSNPRELEDNINEQIAKLRNDVNSQYIEMSNLFGKLKMDVIEANQLKNEAEKELLYIKRELAKNKMASLAYDAELNQVLEKHAPYNNMHINIKDVDPMYSLRNARKDLQSTSNMIYTTDMVNEQNVNRVKQLSALAQAGQNLVGLKAESEFIPINNPGDNDYNNEGNNYGNELLNNDPKNNIAISKTGYKNLDSESYQIYQQNNDVFDKNNMEPKVLEDYTNKGEYSNMYRQLGDIAKINSEMSSESKLKTLSKNYELDYNNFKEKHMEEQKRNINQIDKLIDELNNPI